MKTETEELKEELATLKASFETLKAENKKLNTWEERDKMWLERVRKESFDRDLSKREIDSLKQLNSELVEGIKSVIYARNQYTFFLDGYKNGSASISEVTKASKDENKAFESLISKLNP